MTDNRSEKNWQWIELTPDPDAWESSDDRTRVLLVAINMSGYYSLPVRILALLANQASDLTKTFDVRYVEFDNNGGLDDSADIILGWEPQLVGFSVNIWNRDAAFQMIRQLKQNDPSLSTLVGGQEVSHSVVNYMQENPAIDYLIDGEGELPFLQLLRNWDTPTNSLKNPIDVSGLSFRSDGRVMSNKPSQIIPTLDEIPSPILAGLVDPKKKYKLGIMLEGARGCPFKCSFCFEGGRKIKVRTAAIQRLEQEATFMANQGATYFHIMDPILCNSDPERLGRLTSIFERLTAQNPRIVTSVEAYAHQVTPQVAKSLSKFTTVDVGLQTAHPETARAIHRPWRPEKFKQGLAYLRKAQVSYNLYLISGLPYETLSSYLRGIEEIIKERPTRIFLNELYVLNGTELRRNFDTYGYIFDATPPYILRASKWMPREDIKIAGALSKVVEKHYNLSARAIHTTAPWLPKTPLTRDAKASIPITAPCSLGCKGCASKEATASNLPDNLESVLSRVTDMDVEIMTGDGIELKLLLQLLGQLSLCGVSRIKLTAPMSMFRDLKRVEILIQRGVWHFKTFTPPGEAGLNPKSLRSGNDAWDYFSLTFSMIGHATIKPALEVITLFNDNSELPKLMQHEPIRSLDKRRMIQVTLPENTGYHQASTRQAVSDLFWLGINSRNWIKLPRKHYEILLANRPDRRQILDRFENLDLISHAPNQPPCFQSVERRA